MMEENGYLALAQNIVNSLSESAVRESLIKIFAAMLESNARMQYIATEQCETRIRSTTKHCQQTAQIKQ